MEPAVWLNGLSGGGGVVPVSSEDVIPLEHYFTVCCNSNTRAWEWLTYAANTDRVGTIDGAGCTRFRESVTLENSDTDSAEEMAKTRT